MKRKEPQKLLEFKVDSSTLKLIERERDRLEKLTPGVVISLSSAARSLLLEGAKRFDETNARER